MRAPRILLIVVDRATHLGLRRRLRRRGCEVFEAVSEADAVERVAEVEPDLVVEEHALPSRGAGAFREVLAAIRILAGPLPGRPHRRGWRGHPSHARQRRA